MLVLAAAFLTVGCQTYGTAPQMSGASAASLPSDSLLELVEYGNRVRAGRDADLRAEHRRLATGDTPPSADAAIRLALLLSAPNTPYHDVDQAARMLREVVEGETLQSDGHTALATLLLHLLDESVYSASQGDLFASLSEARERNAELSAALASARSALAEERERRQTLEEQLDALKRLEEQLTFDAL